MLIKELARRTGLSVDTIRFYEKQGLLDETHYRRTDNGYRHYNEVGVQRLSLIKMGQAAGFTLSEIGQTIHAWETDQLTSDEKEVYLYRKLNEIESKLKALTTIKAYITRKIEQMHTELETDAAY